MININLIIALPAEAKPLIKHFRLQQDLRVRSFALYHNKTRSIHLIVSGLGRVASAAAVAYLDSYSSSYKSYKQESVFINLGIAGAAGVAGVAGEDLSQSNKLGSLYLANSIISTSSNQFYYPCIQIIKKYLPEIQSAPCVCVDQPDTSYDYLKFCLIDMESAGFFQAARLFVSQEQIFVLKVVSDRTLEEQKLINAHAVNQWIQSAIPMLNRLIEFCEQTTGSAISSAPAYLDNPYFNQIHFTAHQRHECDNLWRRLQLLGYTVDQIMSSLEKNQEANQKLSASYIVKNLKQLIAQKKPRFSSEFIASC